MKLSFTYLLTIHIPLVLSAAIIPLAGYPLLYLPIHIVWLEIVIHPTAMLVFQDLALTRFPASPPPPGRSSLFSAREWMLVGISGGLLTLLVAGGYVRSLGDGRHVHARWRWPR